jgi:prefoldin subunit 2
MSTEAEEIIDTYKRMSNECSMIATKISELSIERDEHKLVIDTLKKLEPDRKAFRLVIYYLNNFK